MAAIPGFSDLFSQLNSLYAPASSSSQTQGSASSPAPASNASASNAPATDQVLFSSVPSNQPGSSFDVGQQAAPANSGTQQIVVPPSGRRIGMGFQFSLNLSIQHTVISTQQGAGTGAGSASGLPAVNSAGQSYQSNRPSQSTLGNSLTEIRQFQAALFYSRTRTLSTQLDPAQGKKLDATSGKVGRTFELNISLSASFLNQFVGQSQQISGQDSGLFNQYLNHTDQLAGNSDSGQTLQNFFDQVDQAMSDAKSSLQNSLGDFFKNAAQTFGLTNDETQSLKSAVSDQITSFFGDLSKFLSDARAAIAGPQSASQVAATGTAPTVGAGTAGSSAAPPAPAQVASAGASSAVGTGTATPSAATLVPA